MLCGTVWVSQVVSVRRAVVEAKTSSREGVVISRVLRAAVCLREVEVPSRGTPAGCMPGPGLPAGTCGCDACVCMYTR